MQNRPRKRFSLPLHGLYVVCQYLGAAAVCLGYPGATAQTALWPRGPVLPRQALMLWPLLLLAADVLLDRAWMNALKSDLAEEKAGKGPGLHRKAIEAITAPVLFLLDIAAIITILSCQSPDAAGNMEVRLHTAAMAAGIILWVYGRCLPRVPFQSVWGIRTAAANQSVQSWGVVHLRAMPGVCACGALALLGGTFLSPIPAVACAAACLIAAFLFMFTRKAD